jgi:cyclohexanone monooxygenase
MAEAFDCVVVGAGFSGLYAIYRLRAAGFSVQCFEAGVDVGGVWNWNRYPGATVDVLSRDYSYSFSDALQQDWEWNMRFCRQPEILSYQQHVADHFGLREHIALETRVTSMVFDPATNRWAVTTDKGHALSARYVVMACGHLSAANRPDLPGMDEYRGEIHHTGHWPHDGVDYAGKRVGVIGTGSSGIQLITAIAPDVEQLVVFQRSAQFSLPICNGQVDPEEEREFKKGYGEYRNYLKREFRGAHYMAGTPQPSALAVSPEERDAVYEQLWQEGGPGLLRNSFRDIMTSPEANETLADFVRRKIANAVKDQAVAEKLMPRGFPIGTKRICLDEGYYETYNRPNVSLVDIKSEPIERFTPAGVVVGGREYELDIVMFATGYDAFTGSLFKIDIRGRGGETLQHKWRNGPDNYLGMAVSGFPNFFILQGPGSPSVFVNVVTGAEHQTDWLAECLELVRADGGVSIEVDPDAERRWGGYCAALVEGTLFPKADSWWRGANIPGKLRVFYAFLGGFQDYASKCAGEASAGYPSFHVHHDHGTREPQMAS